MTQWGRNRIVRRSLPLLPPGTVVRRVIGAQTRGPWPYLLFFLIGYGGTWSLGWLVWIHLINSGASSWAGSIVGLLLWIAWFMGSYAVGWLSFLAVNRYRIVVVADQAFYLVDCGRSIFFRPRRLLGTFPRAPLGPLRGLMATITIGGHRLHVPRAWFAQVRWADWELFAGQPLWG